jgi:hypothetical protein
MPLLLMKDGSDQRKSAMRIRFAKGADPDRIREVVTASGNFAKEEIETAVELVNESVGRSEESC